MEVEWLDSKLLCNEFWHKGGVRMQGLPALSSRKGSLHIRACSLEALLVEVTAIRNTVFQARNFRVAEAAGLNGGRFTFSSEQLRSPMLQTLHS